MRKRQSKKKASRSSKNSGKNEKPPDVISFGTAEILQREIRILERLIVLFLKNPTMIHRISREIRLNQKEIEGIKRKKEFNKATLEEDIKKLRKARIKFHLPFIDDLIQEKERLLEGVRDRGRYQATYYEATNFFAIENLVNKGFGKQFIEQVI